jgi:hypothetical protein
MRSRTKRSVRARPHAALVGEEFADGADTARAQVIDIIDDALAPLEADQVLRGGDDVAGLEDALLEIDLEAELLVRPCSGRRGRGHSASGRRTGA